MIEELERLVKQISDPALRGKVLEFIRNPSFKLGDLQRDFSISESPASVFRHHSYRHGLLEHTISVTILGITLCEVLEKVYGVKADRDVVIAGCVLHDLMKAPLYEETEDGCYTVSRLGEKIDHISLMVSELNRRGFPIEVIHAVAAHHAEFNVLHPTTLEALIVHVADIADSRLNGKILEAARRLIKEAMGEGVKSINLKDSLELLKIASREGLSSVKKYVEENILSADE
ncbi:dihydroneopterin 2',3'-cyclic phosphate phosphodiesterase [Candidatus Bathyarchaeota archaeon B24-2]|nr:MAG: dihydroneopterin 2',3'-cyclic phosphate phosphodiesterase [Candidatus Bathyarchaeota archaeon B24-2]